MDIAFNKIMLGNLYKFVKSKCEIPLNFLHAFDPNRITDLIHFYTNKNIK